MTFEEAKTKLGQAGVGLYQYGDSYIVRFARSSFITGRGDTLESAVMEGIRREHEGQQRPLTAQEMLSIS